MGIWEGAQICGFTWESGVVELQGEWHGFFISSLPCSSVASPFTLALFSLDTCGLWPEKLGILWLGRRGTNHFFSTVLG